MLATPDIYQHRAPRHHCKGASAENPLGFPRQWQQAHRDVGLVQKPLELVPAVEYRHLFLRARRPDPGRDRKAKRLQHQRRRFGHHAVAEKADTPFLGPNDPFAQPLAIGLSRLVARHVAMKAQHMHDDIFGHHRIAAWRLHLAERDLWQFRMIDKRLDPSRAAKHRFQIRKYRQRVKIGMHKGEVFNIRQLARIWPNANFEIGKLFGKGVAPRLRVADAPVEIDEQQRHTSSSTPWTILDRHSRAGGNPGQLQCLPPLDPRFRGGDH